MDECKAGIQYAFQTRNPFTLALSSTGHSAIECVMVNMLEKGETVLIAENGIWGQRAADMANRNGELMDDWGWDMAQLLKSIGNLSSDL